LAWNRIETTPAAMSPMNIGTKKGEIRPGPSCISTVCCASKVSIPPIPEPMITPSRSGSYPVPSPSPASCIACTAAAIAYWV